VKHLTVIKISLIINTFILTLLLGCSTNKEKRQLSTTAVVTETKHRHWGYGYYKLDVYYKYYNGTDSIIGQTTASRLEHSYTSKYIPGDSLLISYNLDDMTDTYIIKKIYAKPRNKK
jgi:hypothetical protein